MYEGKREVEGRLTSAQTALMLQEEAIRRSDRDRKQQSEKINNLERAVQALESEKRQFQV
jgi:rootletin